MALISAGKAGSVFGHFSVFLVFDKHVTLLQLLPILLLLIWGGRIRCMTEFSHIGNGTQHHQGVAISRHTDEPNVLMSTPCFSSVFQRLPHLCIAVNRILFVTHYGPNISQRNWADSVGFDSRTPIHGYEERVTAATTHISWVTFKHDVRETI